MVREGVRIENKYVDSADNFCIQSQRSNLHLDKGNGIVILDKLDYISKDELLLSDTSKFKKLNRNELELCIKREGQLVRFLRDIIVNN